MNAVQTSFSSVLANVNLSTRKHTLIAQFMKCVVERNPSLSSYPQSFVILKSVISLLYYLGRETKATKVYDS